MNVKIRNTKRGGDLILWKLFVLNLIDLTDLFMKVVCVGLYVYDVHDFYTSTKSWRGYIFTSVCLSVCVCVCVCVCLSVCPFVNKMPIEPLHRF